MLCNAIQTNPMPCNAEQCNAMQCYAMQCDAMRCNALQSNPIQSSTYSTWIATSSDNHDGQFNISTCNEATLFHLDGDLPLMGDQWSTVCTERSLSTRLAHEPRGDGSNARNITIMIADTIQNSYGYANTRSWKVDAFLCFRLRRDGVHLFLYFQIREFDLMSASSKYTSAFPHFCHFNILQICISICLSMFLRFYVSVTSTCQHAGM